MRNVLFIFIAACASAQANPPIITMHMDAVSRDNHERGILQMQATTATNVANDYRRLYEAQLARESAFEKQIATLKSENEKLRSDREIARKQFIELENSRRAAEASTQWLKAKNEELARNLQKCK